MPVKNQYGNMVIFRPLKHISIGLVGKYERHSDVIMVFEMPNDLFGVGAATGSKNGNGGFHVLKVLNLEKYHTENAGEHKYLTKGTQLVKPALAVGLIK